MILVIERQEYIQLLFYFLENCMNKKNKDYLVSVRDIILTNIYFNIRPVGRQIVYVDKSPLLQGGLLFLYTP